MGKSGLPSHYTRIDLRGRGQEHEDREKNHRTIRYRAWQSLTYLRALLYNSSCGLDKKADRKRDARPLAPKGNLFIKLREEDYDAGQKVSPSR